RAERPFTRGRRGASHRASRNQYTVRPAHHLVSLTVRPQVKQPNLICAEYCASRGPKPVALEFTGHSGPGLPRPPPFRDALEYLGAPFCLRQFKWQAFGTRTAPTEQSNQI